MDSKTTHHFYFICEGWVGNFEQELVSYVFDSPNYDQGHRDFSQHLANEDRDRVHEILGEDFLTCFYGEYGLTLIEIDNIRHPETGKETAVAHVEVADSIWKTVDADRAEALIKELTHKFFEARREHSASGGPGNLIEIIHAVREVKETSRSI